VRTHLLRIFDKTGVHRQPELVALTASFAIPLRAEATTA
jgi:DNA-binding CsgD family transcriptional regulator